MSQLAVVDHVYEVEKKNKVSYRETFSQLRQEPFDLIVVPHESFTTARWVATLRGHKIGYRKFWNGLFFNERYVRDWSLPEPLRLLALLQGIFPEIKNELDSYLGAEKAWNNVEGRLVSVPTWASAQVDLPWEVERDLRKFGLSEDYVCLFPGSVWETKKWSLLGYQQLGKKLAHQMRVIVMGGPGEEDVCQKVAEAIPNAISLAGKSSLTESLSIVSRARLVVSNDSAGQHLAAVTGTGTVSIFGPTVLEFGFRPWNSKAIVVEKKDLSCRPCGVHGHHKCPLGHHDCMEKLHSNDVFEAAQLLLK